MIRQSDGDRRTLIIRRLRCGRCVRLHHELPDIVVPYKRYDADTIEEVLSEKETNPSFPCETSTAVRLRVWFLLLRSYFEGTIICNKKETHAIIANRYDSVLDDVQEKVYGP